MGRPINLRSADGALWDQALRQRCPRAQQGGDRRPVAAALLHRQSGGESVSLAIRTCAKAAIVFRYFWATTWLSVGGWGVESE